MSRLSQRVPSVLHQIIIVKLLIISKKVSSKIMSYTQLKEYSVEKALNFDLVQVLHHLTKEVE